MKKNETNVLDRIGQICEAQGCQPCNLIAIMQDIQAEYKYLSEEALTLVAEKLGVAPDLIFSISCL